MQRRLDALSAITATAALLIAAWPAIVVAQDRVAVDPQDHNASGLAYALTFGGTEPEFRLCPPVQLGGPPRPCTVDVPTEEGIASTRVKSTSNPGQRPPFTIHPNAYGLDFYTRAVPRMSITHAGLVGIGTSNPQHLLDLSHAGDVEIGLQSTDVGNRLWSVQSSGTVDPARAGTFQIVDRTAGVRRLGIDAQGLVSVTALQILGGADIAEPFQMSAKVPAGTVVSIDDLHAGHLAASAMAYDHKVAGIVSGANGVQPGLTMVQLDGDGSGQFVALSGRVYALADAQNSPIVPGDLLTTSGLPGHVMRASDADRSHGAIVGKAMTGLSKGTGTVLVLVTLQ